jgi:protein-S-isoprenylcysteine O-methyltransferase Ste14
MMPYVILSAFWLAWCFIHSALISLWVTRHLREKLGDHFRFHRIAYNLLALITLIPVVLYERSLTGPLIFDWTGPAVALRVFLAIASLTLFVAGARHYDGLTFLGLRQLGVGGHRSVLSASGELEKDGILQVTRHPWYLGAILILWTRNLWLPALITNMILSAYLIVGTILEERKLVAEFGDEYRRYQKEVSMLFPARWLLSRIRRRRRDSES